MKAPGVPERNPEGLSAQIDKENEEYGKDIF